MNNNETIRLAMLEQRMTQFQLGRLLGISQAGVSQRIRGDVAWKSGELRRAAFELGIPESDLLPMEPELTTVTEQFMPTEDQAARNLAYWKAAAAKYGQTID